MQASTNDLWAYGACRKCGGTSFKIKISKVYVAESHCSNCDEVWSQAWMPIDRGPEQDTQGDKAMEKAQDEPSNVVSPSEGIGSYRATIEELRKQYK